MDWQSFSQVHADTHPKTAGRVWHALRGRLLPTCIGTPFIERASENAGIENGVELFDAAIHKLTGFHVDELSHIEHAKAVTLPTMVVPVHHDGSGFDSNLTLRFVCVSCWFAIMRLLLP